MASVQLAHRLQEAVLLIIRRSWVRAPPAPLTCLLAVRNQRILAAWDARQAGDARRAAAGRPPKTRRRRRKTLASLATAAPP